MFESDNGMHKFVMIVFLMLSFGASHCLAGRFAELLKQAQNGDVVAINQLELMYKNDYGVAVDDVEAVK